MTDCPFCKIIRKEKAAQIVYEDEKVVAFKDINPQAPVHLLILPRKHISGVTQIKEEDKELIGHIFLVAQKIARDFSIHQCGFRVVVNSGPDSGQAVFHLHFHLLGGRSLKWPPG